MIGLFYRALSEDRAWLTPLLLVWKIKLLERFQWVLNPSKHHKNTSYTHNRTGKSIFLFCSPYFELFFFYDRFIPIQTIVITLLCNVMLTVRKGALATCDVTLTQPSLKTEEKSAVVKLNEETDHFS